MHEMSGGTVTPQPAENILPASRPVRPKRKRARAKKILASVALMTSILAFAPAPAQAGKMVCLTLYYRKFNGSAEYVHDNCYMTTAWTPLTGLGPDCEGPSSIFEACWFVSVSAP